MAFGSVGARTPSKAATWLNGVQRLQSVWFCRPTQKSLLRLLSSQAVLAPYGVPALSNRKALDVFDSFLQDDRIGLIVMSPRGWKLPGVSSRASAQLWMDAYLAAFALSGGYQLITTDGGFRQFSGLDLLVLN